MRRSRLLLSITNEAWRWVFGVVACYGLRPHEAFHLDMFDFPVVQVGEHTKTGDRIVYPLYPEWAEAWELEKVKLPNFQKVHSNSGLGSKVAGDFRDRKIPFHAYDLRHCYARRCFEFSLPPDMAAGLMGHSVQIHMKTYRVWIDKATYRRAYEALHLLISEEPESASIEISPNVTAELNAAGELIGVEILNASDYVRDFIVESVQGKLLNLVRSQG